MRRIRKATGVPMWLPMILSSWESEDVGVFHATLKACGQETILVQQKPLQAPKP